MRRNLTLLRPLVVLALLSCERRTPRPLEPPPPPYTGPGSVVWILDTTVHARGQPAANDSTAFFALQDREVLAVNLFTGAERWRSKLSTAPGGIVGQGCVLIGNTLIVGDTDVYALDALSGALLWHFAPASSGHTGLYRAAAYNEMVLFGSSSGDVFALNARTGTVQWRTKVVPLDAVTVFTPVVHDDLVGVVFTNRASNRGGIASLGATDGSVRWAELFPPELDSLGRTGAFDLAALDGVLVAGNSGGHVHAYREQDGALLWTLPPLYNIPIFGSNQRAVPDRRPTASGSGHLLVGTFASDTLYSIAPATGAVRWWHKTNFGSTPELLIDRDDISVVYGGGQLEVLDPATGKVKWSKDSPEVLYWPAVADSFLVYSSPIGPRAFRR